MVEVHLIGRLNHCPALLHKLSCRNNIVGDIPNATFKLKTLYLCCSGSCGDLEGNCNCRSLTHPHWGTIRCEVFHAANTCLSTLVLVALAEVLGQNRHRCTTVQQPPAPVRLLERTDQGHHHASFRRISPIFGPLLSLPLTFLLLSHLAFSEFMHLAFLASFARSFPFALRIRPGLRGGLGTRLAFRTRRFLAIRTDVPTVSALETPHLAHVGRAILGKVASFPTLSAPISSLHRCTHRQLFPIFLPVIPVLVLIPFVDIGINSHFVDMSCLRTWSKLHEQPLLPFIPQSCGPERRKTLIRSVEHDVVPCTCRKGTQQNEGKVCRLDLKAVP